MWIWTKMKLSLQRLAYKLFWSGFEDETCQLQLNAHYLHIIECVSISFRTGRLERELQMVELSATRCSCIAILWVSLVSFAAITLCVASRRVFVYFVIDSVRKLLDSSSYIRAQKELVKRHIPANFPFGCIFRHLTFVCFVLPEVILLEFHAYIYQMHCLVQLKPSLKCEQCINESKTYFYVFMPLANFYNKYNYYYYYYYVLSLYGRMPLAHKWLAHGGNIHSKYFQFYDWKKQYYILRIISSHVSLSKYHCFLICSVGWRFRAVGYAFIWIIIKALHWHNA
jgi:hypothetical protein